MTFSFHRSLLNTTLAATTTIAVTVGGWIGGVSADENQVPSDRSITDKIEDELIWQPAVSSVRIDAATTDGIVTLTGTVNNLLARERAVRVAESVRGVRSVIDKIEVKPRVVRSNDELETVVKQALFTDPATDDYEIEVEANGGMVTLSGTVDSHRERELATTVVKGVSGVRIIDNRLVVDNTSKRSDAEMKAEIEQTLRWNTLVDAALITVQVEDSKVSLSGKVGSAAERTQAKLDSWVAGITGVDASDLEVVSWLHDDNLRDSKYVFRSEKEIGGAIRDALAQDPRVLSFHVDVDVDGRDVTLRGEVDNLKAKRAAASIARHTAGVLAVDDRLRVRPTTVFEDAKIGNDVEEAILRDPFIDRYEIRVVVIDGVVHLYGEVDTEFEKGQADDIASRVNGVLAVENHLNVDDSAASYPYSPYWDTSDYYDYDWFQHKPAFTTMTDAEIKEQIESELWWSPFVDSEEITVKVQNGVATLSGRVSSLVERDAAVDNARQGGARWVQNEIELHVD